MNAERVFVDTNILVYAFDATEPDRQARARAALEDLMSTDRLRLSVQVLREFYVVVTSKVRRPLSHDQACAIIDDLLHFPIQDETPRLFRTALDLKARHHLSPWDALIVMSAQTAGCTTLLTEDMNDGQSIDGLKINNPFACP